VRKAAQAAERRDATRAGNNTWRSRKGPRRPPGKPHGPKSLQPEATAAAGDGRRSPAPLLSPAVRSGAQKDPRRKLDSFRR